MDGEAPSGALASSHTFLNNHPDLDLWNLLGVPPDSKFGVISKAYRNLARQYHPDALINLPEAERRRRTEVFQLMGEAREILTNPITRAQYAAWRLRRRGNPAPSNRGRTPGQAERYEEAQAQARAREARTPPRPPNWAGFSGEGVPPRASEPASSSGSRDNPWNTGGNRGFPSDQPSWRRTTSWEGQPPGGAHPSQGPWTQPKGTTSVPPRGPTGAPSDDPWNSAPGAPPTSAPQTPPKQPFQMPTSTPPRGSTGVPFEDPWNSAPGAPPASAPKTPPKQPFQMPFNSNPWQGGATTGNSDAGMSERPKKAAPPPYGSVPQPARKSPPPPQSSWGNTTEQERPKKAAPPPQPTGYGNASHPNVPPPAERKRTRDPQPYAGAGQRENLTSSAEDNPGRRPPPASREFYRTPQPYHGRGPTEVLRPPRAVLENEVLEEGIPERSAREWEEVPSETPEMPPSRAWSEADDGRSDHTSQGWEKESLNSWDVPDDPQDGEFVHVEVESSDEDWFDVPFDESEWAGEPGAPPGGDDDISEEQKEFERNLHQDITEFLEFFRKQKLVKAAPALKDLGRHDTPLPEAVRQDCVQGSSGGLRLDRSVQEWLQRGLDEGARAGGVSATNAPADPAQRNHDIEKNITAPAPKTGVPPKAMPISPPPAKWLGSPTPPSANVGLSSKASTPAAPTTRTQAAQTTARQGSSSHSTHHGFDPTEVDFGEESEDDRTPEEKADDDALLERTKQNIEAFFRAPETIKRQLRSSAWKKCYAQLASIRAKLDRPDPGADEAKCAQDLADGFTVAEARKMMKARRRAAKHQRVIEENPNLTWDDLPRSWIVPKQRTLRPGWMAEKSEARLNRKRSGSQPAGKGYRDRWGKGVPEPKYPPGRGWGAAPAPTEEAKKPKPSPPAPPGWKAGQGAAPAHPSPSPCTPPKQGPKQPPYPPPPSRFNEEEWGSWTAHGKK
eukprot:Skav202900  [mRNA]  locus=scaffold3908:24001:26868:+ [translate_table: standard]